MDAKVQILDLFSTLSILDKIEILEELASIFEKEQQIDSQMLRDKVAEFQNDITQTSVNEAYIPCASIQTENIEIALATEFIGLESNNQSVKMSELAAKKVTQCPECASLKTIRWGKYKNTIRLKCNDCRHTFTENTRNVFHGIKKIDEFVDFGESMFNGQFNSLSYLSTKYEISLSTAFDWRHKYLSSMNSSGEKTRFKGKVEMDDVWVAFNEKGRKGKIKSRKRSGLDIAGDSDLQVKILFTLERGGEADMSVVRSGRLCKEDIARTVGNSFEKEALLISDKHPSISAFAKEAHIRHENFKASKHSKDKEIHVQTINNMASRFKGIINTKMRGVATKYLQNYAKWFNIEDRYKNLANKIVNITQQHLKSQLAWDYFVNIEKTYKRFLEKYSRLPYEHPSSRDWKSCNWNYEKIEKLLSCQ